MGLFERNQVIICFMTTVILGLGSNIGDRFKNLQNAIKELAKGMTIKKSSFVYETKPWGFTEQGKFLNACISVETEMPPRELLLFIKEIEKRIGRKPSFRWGPRVIDIDILYYGEQVIKDDNLVIPHPELQNRDFVLIPLNDVAPNFLHPLLKKTTKEMLVNVSSISMKKYGELII